MSYKSSHFRRGAAQNPKPSPADNSNPKVQQLQEMFPGWSEDDLKSLLSDVHNDVELAVTRISEGHAEQWGEVPRKKEKKPASTTVHSAGDHHQTRESGAGRDKGDNRGVRGGRGGGRGGRGGMRGGISARGTTRGGHRELNGRHASSPAPADASVVDSAAGWSTAEPTTNGGAFAEDTTKLASSTDWGSETFNDFSSSGGFGQAPPGLGASSEELKGPPKTVQPSKTPATSKMSWAQIARASEKPKTPTPAPATATVPAPVQEAPAPVPDHVQEDEPQISAEVIIVQETKGWEEPTTAEGPTWEEPESQSTLIATQDDWPPSSDVMHSVQTTVLEITTISNEQLEPEPVPDAFPVQQPSPVKALERSPVPAPAKSATPVSYAKSLSSHRNSGRFKTTDQPVVMPSSNFGSVMEKIGMQFGSVSLGGEEVSEFAPSEQSPEKIAKPLESNSILDASQQPPDVQTHIHQLAGQAVEPAPSSTSAVPSSVSQSSLPPSHSLLQQSLPRQALQEQQQQGHIPPQLQQKLQQTTPSSFLQAASPSSNSISSHASNTTATSSPLSTFTQQTTPSTQPTLSPYQQQSQTLSHSQSQIHSQQQQAQQQSQSQLHQQFSQQHGFQSHSDGANSQSLPTQTQQQQQQAQNPALQGLGNHGSYYRQQDTYFQAATPPAAQGQSQDAGYPSFPPSIAHLQHQNQGSHLSGFSGEQFGGAGYSDNTRGFYENYGQQQSGFGGRNVSGHEDVGKNLSGVQQSSQTASVPQAQQQGSQPPAQSAAQTTGPTNQAQQGYPPLPYYYNPYHQTGQFYGAPYGSYNQFGGRYQPQQQPLFQPPANSASPANAKVPGAVQQQSNPYAQSVQGLYGQQQHMSGYEDNYSHHNQLQGQGVNALGSSEYSKPPLYGAQGGIQSFMSMGQSAQPSSNSTLGQRGAGGSSPENPYKPYGGPGVGAGGKDVVSGSGVGGVSTGQSGLGQGARGGIQQQPLGQSFYGGNRFSGNSSAGGPPPAQPQQNQGYQQGGGDNFYYQRGPSQQQQYWQ